MSSQRYIGLRLLLVLMTTYVSGVMQCIPPVLASDNVNEHGQRELALTDLPKPPREIQTLLARGDVTFLIGGMQPSSVDPDDASTAKRRKFDAETRYHMSYTFKSHCRWSFADPGQSQRLAIQTRYEKLQLEVEHRVWLREMPEIDSFWDSPLVRHELDHIRLSSDSRLNSRFVEAVEQLAKIELTPDESRPLLAAATSRKREGTARNRTVLSRLVADDAQRWVEDRVRAEFDRTVELVEIRYRELDRQTDHGRKPVPDVGEVNSWLTPNE